MLAYYSNIIVANPNAKCEDGTTALFVACQNGKTEIVRRLLALPSIRINSASTEDGSTPLYIACQNGHLSVVEALLEVTDIGKFEHVSKISANGY